MITYPVTDETKKFAFVVIATSEITKDNVDYFKQIQQDGLKVTPPDGMAILEVIHNTRPAYDNETQNLISATPVIDLVNEEYILGWDIIALTQEELDALAVRAARDAERETAKSFYSALQAGTGTQLERLVRCEKVAAWTLREVVGD